MKVRLRAIEPSDSAIICVWYNDDEVNYGSNMKVLPVPNTKIRRDIEHGYYDNDRVQMLMIVSDEKPIGLASISSIDKINRNAELGIMIGETDHWNSGYSQHVCMLLMILCFEEMRLNKIYGSAYEHNRASGLMWSLLGAHIEGGMRQCLFRFGRYWDKTVFSVLASEWFEKRSTWLSLAGFGKDDRSGKLSSRLAPDSSLHRLQELHSCTFNSWRE